MNSLRILQIFTGLLIGIMLASFVMAILGRLPWLQFWILAALMAITAYWIIPSVRKKIQ